jgi:hypothetical protein
MTSSAYRQASRRDVGAQSAATSPGGENLDPEAVDPANHLLWRMRLRRLESEVVRDSILAVSGKLNRALGGPPVPISAQPDGMVVVAKDKLTRPEDAWRRSVYLLTRRAYNVSLLTVFDQPLVATNCLARDESAVPLQSLVMLNDALLAEQADEFARRIERCGAKTADAQIELAFRTALARRPTAAERATCHELVEAQTKGSLAAGSTPEAAARTALVQVCHVLFNTSEFLYAE